MSDSERPQAGWVTFEREKLLIGGDPTLGLLEREPGEFGATWWPDGPPDAAEAPEVEVPEHHDLFEGREAEAAWRAAVEICASSKGRLDFEGAVWSHVWLRFESSDDEWARRARESKPESEVPSQVAGFSVQPGESGGCELEPRAGGSLLGAETHWTISPEGLGQSSRRFGITSGEREVERDHVYAVAILAADSDSEGGCTVAVAGQGLYTELCQGVELEAARTLRHVVLAALAGELLQEWRPGAEG